MTAEVRRAGHVPEWKIKEVDELVEKIGNSRVVAVIGVREIPASDIQRMRAELRSTSEIRMVRNNIARRAFDMCEAGLKPLSNYIEDQSALIFTDANPFALKKLLDAERRPMAIRAGTRSPKDIVVDAGETSFSPGPMVGKLQSAGVPAAIKGGKVVINQTTVLAREGEIVSPKLAEVLQLMEIFPKEVGLELRAAYEGGLIFRAEDLSINVEALLADLSQASARAFSLAVEIAYATPQTINPILQLAQGKARGLVAECALPVPGMMNLVLGKAVANARAVVALMDGGAAEVAATTAEAKVEEATEEKKEEESEEDMAAGLGSLFG
ncbi:MAG: 50S ribosomal protein L10 [Methanosarcinales archaeon]|nr:50S ribosomal protein L10 [Methanosarcinales archaeon]